MKKRWLYAVWALLAAGLLGCGGMEQDVPDAPSQAEESTQMALLPMEESSPQEEEANEKDADERDAQEKPAHAYEWTLEQVPQTGYAYQCLSEMEQLWYLDMLAVLQDMKSKVKLSDEPIKAGLSGENLDKVFQCVMTDHPEIFYVEGFEASSYTLASELVSLDFSGVYTMDEEQRQKEQAAIEEGSLAMLSGLSPQSSDYEKVLYLYETIILGTTYDLEAPNNQNVYSVLVDHASVCQGYSKAFQLLCLRMGIPCTLVVGLNDQGVSHAWNLVQLDGNYYLSDITWGDAYYAGLADDETQSGSIINYDYFLMTSKEFDETHVTQMDIPIPKCVSVENNYFVKEKAYFSQRDEEGIAQVFARANATQRSLVNLKFETDELYREMKEYLVEDGKVYALWEGIDGKLFFATNEDVRTMTFWVTNE